MYRSFENSDMKEWDWEKGQLGAEDVRKWGYDEDMFLLSQDEDLVLHDPKYIAVLMELSSDNQCPKQEYSLRILYYYTQIYFCLRDKEEIEQCYQNMLMYEGDMSLAVIRWKENFLLMKGLLNNPHPVDSPQADEIAMFLIGARTIRDYDTGALITSSCDLAVLHESIFIRKHANMRMDHYQYETSWGGYARYLYINPSAGTWKFSRNEQLIDRQLKDQ